MKNWVHFFPLLLWSWISDPDYYWITTDSMYHFKMISSQYTSIYSLCTILNKSILCWFSLSTISYFILWYFSSWVLYTIVHILAETLPQVINITSLHHHTHFVFPQRGFKSSLPAQLLQNQEYIFLPFL